MAKFDLSKYDTVADRIARFRAEHPEGAIYTRIVTELSSFNEVVCEAEIWFNIADTRPVARDIAAEWKGENFSSGANFTAWHENAATSAIGRALDAAGYSKNKEAGRASREEMEKVERHSKSTPPPVAANTRPNLQVVNTAKSYEPTWEGFTAKADDFGFASMEADDYLTLANHLLGKRPKGWNANVYGLCIGESDAKWKESCERMKNPATLIDTEPEPTADRTLEAMSK
jgi:hypothetical protein